MALPTAATFAGLAYLNAKWRVSYDLRFINVVLQAKYHCWKRERQDRFNAFYVLEEHAQNKNVADKPFILFEDRRITFKQFYELVLHYAGWLHSAHHVAQGEIVAIDFMNGPEFLLLAFALFSLGAVPALINYNLLGNSLAHSLRTSSCRLFLVESEVADSVLTPETRSMLSSPTFRHGALPMETVVLDQGLRSSIEYYKQYRAPDSARSGPGATTPAVLMSTSGTTGLPKQAMVSWLRLTLGGCVSTGVCNLRPITAKDPDVYYTAMPLYHGTAFMGGLYAILNTPTTLAISRKFSVSAFWPEVRRHKATCIQYVGEAMRYLLAAPPTPEDTIHNVRLAHGNGLRLDVWKRFRARFGIDTIVEFYGATEGTFATFNVNRNEFGDGAIASDGTLANLIRSQTVAIVKVDWAKDEPWRDPKTGFCVKVPTGQAGEMLAKLDPSAPRAFFNGYYDNEEASTRKITRSVFVKDDAYFRSGDVVRCDAEGRLWFSDRIGDTFRWKSENVSTTEVGEVIGCHPEVLEANVYGVRVPGHEGRAGCAAIVLRDSAWQDSAHSPTVTPDVLESLATYSRNSLPKYSVPVFLRVVREMVVTGNNKTLKHLLRSQGVELQAIENAGSGDTLYWLQPNAERYVQFESKDWAALKTGKVRL